MHINEAGSDKSYGTQAYHIAISTQHSVGCTYSTVPLLFSRTVRHHLLLPLCTISSLWVYGIESTQRTVTVVADVVIKLQNMRSKQQQVVCLL